MSAARVVLRLSDVEKRYPGVRALKGVSFDVRAGEVHALVGENGAGKSTLMGVAAGTIVPDEGAVEIDGTPLDDASPAAAQLTTLIAARAAGLAAGSSRHAAVVGGGRVGGRSERRERDQPLIPGHSPPRDARSR